MSDETQMLDNEIDVAAASDAEFLTGLAWSAAAPEDLQRAAQSGRVDKFWRAWSKRIGERCERKSLRKRVACRSSLWPWDGSRRHPAKTVWSMIEKQDWRKLSRWATQQLSADDAWKDERTELELLALADWLLSGPRVEAAAAWPVWRLVMTRSAELAAYLSEPLTCELTPDRRLLVTGELPWLLGLLFGDFDGVTEFKQLGQQSLRNELIELTDSDGTPAVTLLPVLLSWLASFARSVEVGQVLQEPLLEGEARFRFEDLLAKSVLLLDRNGELLGSTFPTTNGTTVVSLLLRAAELAGLDKLSLAAESLRHRQHIAAGGAPDKFRSDTYSEVPEERLIVTDTDLPATQSDWASWACLRNWWNATANTAIVKHDGRDVTLQLSLLGVPVIDGTWGLNVRLDGQPISWTDGWKCSCWSSDTDMDYLELQLDIPDGSMLCRQIMLSRKDHFLVLADSVANAGRHRIDFESTLPLRHGVRAKSDKETREVQLATSDVKVRCFPLALPDDRLHSTVGEFDAARGELRLTQAATSESLYAPIVLDWSPDRASQEAEWRTLTVTEEGRKVAAWEAAGHRLRLGKLHLVVYRSLNANNEFRAVLGLHTDKESVIAQFDDKGYVLPIVSVDS